MSLNGELWEVGSYKGGTALFFRMLSEKYLGTPKIIRLFDTFDGMPETSDRDIHNKGDFSNTSLDFVKVSVGSEEWYFIPQGLCSRDFHRSRSAQYTIRTY